MTKPAYNSCQLNWTAHINSQCLYLTQASMPAISSSVVAKTINITSTRCNLHLLTEGWPGELT